MTSGKVKVYNLETQEVENTIPDGFELGYIFVSYSDEGNIQMFVVKKFDEVSSSAVFVHTLCYPKGKKTDDIIDSYIEILGELVPDYVLHLSEENVPHIPSSIIKNKSSSDDVINIVSMKVLNPDMYGYFEMFKIFFSKDETVTYQNDGVPDDIPDDMLTLKVAVPLHEDMDIDLICGLLSSVMKESIASTFDLKAPTAVAKRAITSSLGGSSGVKASSVSSTPKTVQNYPEVIQKVRDFSDSCINSQDNIAKILRKLGLLYRSVQSGENITAETRLAVDMYKGAKKEQNLKAKAVTNFKLSFDKWPNSLDEVDGMAFDTKERYDANFFVTITTNDFKTLGVTNQDEKRGVLVALVREYARQLIRIYGDNGVISDDRYEELFNGDVKPESSSTSGNASLNNFNKLRTGISAKTGSTAASARIQSTMASKTTASKPASSISALSKFSKPNFAKAADAKIESVVVDEGVDVYDIPESEIEEMHPFRWTHQECACRILSAHDGDTLDALVDIPVQDFGKAVYLEGRAHKPAPVCKLNGQCSTSLSMKMIFKIRCFNYDAAETYTKKGLVLTKAFEKFIAKITELRVPCTVTFEGANNNNREVATVRINDITLADGFSELSIDDIQYIKYPYNGHEKSDFSDQFEDLHGEVGPRTQATKNSFLRKEYTVLKKEFLESDECNEEAQTLYDQMIKIFKIQTDVKKSTVNPTKSAKQILQKTEEAPAKTSSALAKFGLGKKTEEAPPEKSRMSALIGKKPDAAPSGGASLMSKFKLGQKTTTSATSTPAKEVEEKPKASAMISRFIKKPAESTSTPVKSTPAKAKPAAKKPANDDSESDSDSQDSVHEEGFDDVGASDDEEDPVGMDHLSSDDSDDSESDNESDDSEEILELSGGL